MRTIVEATAYLLIALLMVQTFGVSGWLPPLRVDGGSMAESLLGPHRRAHCDQCGHSFACGVEPSSAAVEVGCLNCGQHGVPLDEPVLPGKRVLIDRASVQFVPLQRWEPVALRHPQRSAELCVKRLIGLPNEEVVVRNGDVFINGAIGKPLTRQREMAALVHRGWRHWSPDDSAQWRFDDQRLSHPAAIGNTTDWITFEHRRAIVGAGDQRMPQPVTDDTAYNPNESRQLNLVTDLMLVVTIAAEGAGQVHFRVHDGREWFEASLGIGSESVVLRCANRPVARAPLPALAGADLIHVVLSLFDQQVLLAVDDYTILEFPYEASSAKLHPLTSPLALGADASVDMQIIDLAIYRDLFYTPPPVGTQPAWGLGDDQWFVLGDNSPLSEDSRHWGTSPVTTSLLLGRLLRRWW